MKTNLLIVFLFIFFISIPKSLISASQTDQKPSAHRLRLLDKQINATKSEFEKFTLMKEFAGVLNELKKGNSLVDSMVGQDWVTSGWVNKDKTEYSYADSPAGIGMLRKVTETSKVWNTTDWLNISQKTTIYDPDGKPISIINTGWGNGAWKGVYTANYTYNLQGQLVEIDKVVYDSGTAGPNMKVVFEHYPDGKVKKELQMQFLNGNWVNYVGWDYSYEAVFGKLGEKLTSMNLNGTWTSLDKTIYAYDAFGNEISQYSYFPTQTGLNPSNRTIETYYTAEVGALLKDKTLQTYNSSVRDYINHSVIDYIYTTTKNLELQTTSVWDNTKKLWNQKEKYTHTYNAEDDETGYVREERIQDIWTNKYKLIITYKTPVVKKSLAISVNPARAAQSGCSTTPAPGTYDYNKDENVTLNGIDNPAAGWIFKEWSGSVSGTSKSVSVKMDDNKTAVANFAEVILTVAGNRAQEFACSEKFITNKTYNMLPISLTASIDDDWRVLRINLETISISDYHWCDILNINLMRGNSIIGSVTGTSITEVEQTLFLTTPLIIPKGTTVNLLLTYEFKVNPETRLEKDTSLFIVSTKSVNANPVNYTSGLILGNATADTLTIGRVINTRTKTGFSKIQNSINYSTTLEGDTCLVCSGDYIESVNFKKGIVLKSAEGRDKTQIISEKPIDSLCNHTNIDGFSINKLTPGITYVSYIWFVKLKNCRFTYFDLFIMKGDSLEIIDNEIEAPQTWVLHNVSKSKFSYNRSTKSDVILNFVTSYNNDISENTGFWLNFKSNYDFPSITTKSALNSNSLLNSTLLSYHRFNKGTPGLAGNPLANGTWNFYGSNENKIINNETKGITIEGSSGNFIQGNKITEGYSDGINIKGENISYSNDNYITENEIFNVGNSGILVDGAQGTIIDKNKIYNCYHGGIVFERAEGAVVKNNILRNNPVDGLRIESGSNIEIYNNNISENTEAGILATGVNGLKISSNTLWKNCTGIKFNNCSDFAVGINRIYNSFCLFSGISMSNSNGEIFGNSIENNNGNGIYTSQGSNPLIRFNNILGNSVFNLNNADPAVTLNASGNYWGSPDGPGANTINGNVNSTGWLTSTNSLAVLLDQDTLNIPSGHTDSVAVFIKDHTNSSGVATIAITDPQGWCMTPSPVNINLDDSLGITTYIKFAVPVNPSASLSKVMFRVTSASTPSLEIKDSLFIITYSAQISKIEVDPDTVKLAPKAAFLFSALCYDQKGNIFSYSPSWYCTGGTIDQTGLYKADSIKGIFKVTATYPGGSLKGESVVYLDDQKGKVKGAVCYDNANNTPLPNVTVKLKPVSGGNEIITSTNNSGSFVFDNLNNGSYNLSCLCSGIWGGANATDALLVRRHTIGAMRLENLRYMAADVNLSNDINSTDALLIGQRFTGQINSFAAGDWKFESADAIVYSDSINYKIKGICTGDVNASYIPGAAKIQPAIQLVKSGKIYFGNDKCIELPVSADRDFSAGAISIVVSYPARTLKIKTVTGLNNKANYFEKNGIIKIFCYDEKQMDYNQGEVLFILNFEKTSETTELNNMAIEPESELADINGNIIKGVNFLTPSVESSLPNEYSLMQNFPNPFNPVTIIRYSLPVKSLVNLAIYDMLGREVKTLVSEEKDAGYYTVEWRGDNNSGQRVSSGTYIYRIISNDYSSVKKLILLK